jgi:hypothetical protein
MTTKNIMNNGVKQSEERKEFEWKDYLEFINCSVCHEGESLE